MKVKILIAKISSKVINRNVSIKTLHASKSELYLKYIKDLKQVIKLKKKNINIP